MFSWVDNNSAAVLNNPLVSVLCPCECPSAVQGGISGPFKSGVLIHVTHTITMCPSEPCYDKSKARLAKRLLCSLCRKNTQSWVGGWLTRSLPPFILTCMPYGGPFSSERMGTGDRLGRWKAVFLSLHPGVAVPVPICCFKNLKNTKTEGSSGWPSFYRWETDIGGREQSPQGCMFIRGWLTNSGWT